MTNKYEQQAVDFLSKYKIDFSYALGNKPCVWGNNKHQHYIVTFTRKDKTGKLLSLVFDFWGSEQDYKQGKLDLSAYDVLSIISGDDQYKSIRDVYDNLGREITGINIRALLNEARKMRHFFTRSALIDLQEIV